MHQRSEPKPSQQKTTFGSLAIGFVVCVLAPGFVTAIAPVSWVHFERKEQTVSATTKTCVFFVIPYRVQKISSVVGIDDRFIAGTRSNRQPGERDRDRTTSDAEAKLQIHGEEQIAEVSVSPVDIESVVERSQKFLDDNNAKELKFGVIANWKFGGIMGGIASLFTLLYVFGVSMWILQSLRRLMTGIVRGSVEPPDSESTV